MLRARTRLFSICFLFVAILLCSFQPRRVVAQQSSGIHGTVRDSGKVIVGAKLRLLELDRTTYTNSRGEFFFANVPKGSYTLFVQVLGYASASVVVNVVDSVVEASFLLRESAIQGKEVVISGTPYARREDELYQSVDSKSRVELHQSAGSSFAEEIGDLPGVAVRYNGSAPARPILRGLSNNEVLILENGLRTGDISTYDPAHAVPIEPEAISEIEVIRGPASLMFGSNAIGGLVNVITNIIPVATVDGVSGRVSATGNSASNLYSGYFNTAYSSGGHTFSISAGGVHSDAIKIPDGTYTDPTTPRPQTFHLDTIPQSFNHTSEEGIGYSYQGDFGMIGIGAKHYQMNYGIPGDPADQLYKFPTTSRIAQEKYALELRGLFEVNGSLVKQVKLNANAVDYLHSEHPTLEDSTGLVSEFEQNSFHQNGYNGTLQVLLQRMGNFQGTIGIFANLDNLTLDGPQPLGPNSLTTNLAGYIYEEYVASENTRLQGGIRFDYDKIQTNPAPNSAVAAFRGSDTSRLANAFTGSLGIIQKLSSTLSTSFSIARSFRAPTVQELFGNGPDDASASFIVGDPGLVPETGLGFDASMNGRFENFTFSVSPYLNLISNYIYSYFPGGVDTVSQYPLRYFAQTDARLYGFEVSTTMQIVEHIAFTANMDYVNASGVRDSIEPLPFTPPMKGLLRLNYRDDIYAAMIEWRVTAAQDRVALDETATAGYGVVNLGFGVHILTGGAVHEISLHCDNLLNQQYFDHLSVFHQFLPMPARGFRLTYDLLF